MQLWGFGSYKIEGAFLEEVDAMEFRNANAPAVVPQIQIIDESSSVIERFRALMQ